MGHHPLAEAPDRLGTRAAGASGRLPWVLVNNRALNSLYCLLFVSQEDPFDDLNEVSGQEYIVVEEEDQVPAGHSDPDVSLPRQSGRSARIGKRQSAVELSLDAPPDSIGSTRVHDDELVW